MPVPVVQSEECTTAVILAALFATAKLNLRLLVIERTPVAIISLPPGVFKYTSTALRQHHELCTKLTQGRARNISNTQRSLTIPINAVWSLARCFAP
jgi:hypothetical protein